VRGPPFEQVVNLGHFDAASPDQWLQLLDQNVVRVVRASCSELLRERRSF
jgi:hypothetical protein